MANNKVVVSSVNLNTRALSMLDDAVLRACEQAADTVRGEIVEDGVMPYEYGHMQNDQTSTRQTGNGAQIVTAAPQARRLYYHPEYDFTKTKNPGAGGEWLKNYEDGRRIRHAFADQLKRNGGGYIR